MERARALPELLLVDDDASSRAILGLALRSAGFHVSSCGGVQEALALLARRRFRWLVTDGMMEPEDGFILARRARALDRKLRIAMVSALYQRADDAEGTIDRFFPKPIPLEDLIEWLRTT